MSVKNAELRVTNLVLNSALLPRNSASGDYVVGVADVAGRIIGDRLDQIEQATPARYEPITSEWGVGINTPADQIDVELDALHADVIGGFGANSDERVLTHVGKVRRIGDDDGRWNQVFRRRRGRRRLGRREVHRRER